MSVTKIDRARQAQQALADKNFRVLLFTPTLKGTPSGAVIEIYQLGATLRRLGYNASILTETADYQVPAYLDEDLQALPHVAAGDESLSMKPEDVIIIPEYFTSVIASTRKLSSLRVVLAQGYDNMLTTMVPGTTWAQLGIKHVLTMSAPLTAYVKDLFGDQYAVQTLRIGIPDYFQPAPVKDPIIAVQVRNANDLKKIAHEFYLRYPELKWVGFEPLTGVGGRKRTDYAALLGKATAALWVDRIASFGQTAVEAMKSGTPLVALVPDHEPEYITDTNAIWVGRFPELATALGKVVKLQLENGLPETYRQGAAETAAQYSPAAAEASVATAFANILAARTREFEDIILFNETKEAAPAAQ